MKLLKGFMAVALIGAALTGASFAAHNLADQAHDTVKNIADMGYTSNKKFTFSREAVDSVLHNDFDATQGTNDNVRRAKAYLKGTVDKTVNFFAGGDLPTKKGAFLEALDKAIANKGGTIEVNLDTIGFNVANVATGQQIADSAQLFFEEINPKDSRETLLKQAKLLSIQAKSVDGTTTVDSLLQELATAGHPTGRNLVLDKVAALNDLGKAGDKTLQQKVDARLAKHGGGGKYEAIGLDKDEQRIGAFHEVIRDSREAGKLTAQLKPEEKTAVDFTKKIFELVEDGVIQTVIPLNGVNNINILIESSSNLSVKISNLEGKVYALNIGEVREEGLMPFDSEMSKLLKEILKIKSLGEKTLSAVKRIPKGNGNYHDDDPFGEFK